MKKIEFFKHNIDEDDIARASNVLRSIFLTTGEETDGFEREFAAYTGRAHTVGVTSCTAALHLSLLALGIKPGDEVITTPMSFCATSNAILHTGARPVFVDVEPDTGNLDASLVELAVSERTRAILPVHLYGQMCDMKALRSIADRHGLFLIEDAAHAIEASRDGIRPGELSDAVCYSFYATKNITSGEGGAVCTDNTELAERLRILRLHGIDRSAADRYQKRFMHWDMHELGWKYNMDSMQAALLRGQLRRIDGLWEERNRLWGRYENSLTGLRNLRLLKTLQHVKHARHLFTALVPADKRDIIVEGMQARGVGVAVNYRPIHLLSYYKKTLGYNINDYPITEAMGAATVSLPLYPKLTDEEQDYVVSSLKETVETI